MARVSEERLCEIEAWGEDPLAPAPVAEIRQQWRDLVADLREAQAEREQLCRDILRLQAEQDRLKLLLQQAGTPDPEAPYLCEYQGCGHLAKPGARLCDDESHDASFGVFRSCLVRGCREERASPLTFFCFDHRTQWRVSGLSGWDFVASLFAPPAPPAPVPGLGLQVTTHGLPADVDPTPVGVALTQATASAMPPAASFPSTPLEGSAVAEETPAPPAGAPGDGASGASAGSVSSPPPTGAVSFRCIYGQCAAPRAPGHALCTHHLGELDCSG